MYISVIQRNIYSLCRAKGWSTYRLSEESQVPYSTLLGIVNGKTREPRIETLRRLASALGVSTSALYGDALTDTGDGIFPAADEGREALLRELDADGFLLLHVLLGLSKRRRRQVLEYAMFLQDQPAGIPSSGRQREKPAGRALPS